MKQLIRTGFSPCPNDCFIFDALLHQKINVGNFTFEPVIEDVEKLNQRAMRGELELTKMSYHAYLYCQELYTYLNSGSALGFGCGPLLITHSEDIQKQFFEPQSRRKMKVLIPGELTTAHYLLKKFFSDISHKTSVLFSEIEDLLVQKRFDAGLIIHENRFTYPQKGLLKIVDLGALWEKETGLPIPLGGIMVKRTLGTKTIQKIDSLVRQSVEYAFQHYEDVLPFVRTHAQTMQEDVIKQHINLYVNTYSIDLGAEGRKAIEYFCKNY